MFCLIGNRKSGRVSEHRDRVGDRNSNMEAGHKPKCSANGQACRFAYVMYVDKQGTHEDAEVSHSAKQTHSWTDCTTWT